MTKLSTHARAALPSSAFVFPKTRSYPIHDVNHARAALSDVSRSGNAAEKSAVRAAVARKYPDMGDAEDHAKDAAGTSDAPTTPSEGLMGT